MKKAIKWLDDNLEEFLLVLLLLGMAVIMGIQVFSRFALKASLSWTEELTRYLFIWAGFLSLSYCCKRCISIKIEQFVAQFSRRTKAIIKVITHTVELAFFLYMIPYTFMYMMSAVESGQVSPALGMPMVYVQAARSYPFCWWHSERCSDGSLNSEYPWDRMSTIRPIRSAIPRNPL